MNKKMYLLLLLVVFFTMACSSNESGSEDLADDNSYEETGQEESYQSTDMNEIGMDQGDKNTVTASMETEKRMVMYNANLTIEVKDIKQAVDQITEKTASGNGYIVESFIANNSNQLSAHMKVRIPNDILNTFLTDVESISSKVREKQLSGQDVTEEYNDLQSRLKAKRAVEERLLAFMKDAEKTEDLLKISKDLSTVQEEIEQLEGRKKFLENKTDYAEINISLIDVAVSIPDVPEEDLQTGEKIKEAFVQSLNMMAKMFSALAVFFIGYSPFIFIIGLLIALLWYVNKRKKASENKKPE
ncbi:thiol:disulfide interchange protein [Salirhabdus euzebyi]|uniref:Thiol:disulfide interchange protein n=1 Tax=Salirhabdus euzebyi TaxID=394506 RepID=A0A841PWQ2_9BACI|nr:DUF4349 domain-containing protein [Salirhabdus euzebyi]MBB6452334.1 thiol:disulfide interchange protein [Salirhabdus euzebyi]